jgi:hypothetical protein
MNKNYKTKYLKYKEKYLNYKNQKGGDNEEYDDSTTKIINLNNKMENLIELLKLNLTNEEKEKIYDDTNETSIELNKIHTDRNNKFEMMMNDYLETINFTTNSEQYNNMTNFEFFNEIIQILNSVLYNISKIKLTINEEKINSIVKSINDTKLILEELSKKIMEEFNEIKKNNKEIFDDAYYNKINDSLYNESELKSLIDLYDNFINLQNQNETNKKVIDNLLSILELIKMTLTNDNVCELPPNLIKKQSINHPVKSSIFTKFEPSQSKTTKKCIDIGSNSSKTKEIYDLLKLNVVKQSGDGNCLFRSLSYGLFKDPEYHELVRSNIMKYIDENKDFFRQFTHSDINESLTKPKLGQWGDHIDICAFVNLYNIVVIVINMEQSGRQEIITPIQTMTHSKHESGFPKVIYLEYVGKNHYNYLEHN